jgi:hypothetical protein
MSYEMAAASFYVKKNTAPPGGRVVGNGIF